MADVVAPYDVERETVDGNDVVAVWDAFGRFLVAAREGRGPFLLECLTQRLRGHYEGDAAKYRKAPAARELQENDPILRLQRRGVAEGWFAEDAPVVVEAGAADAVEQAVLFARESAFPPVDLIGRMVYA